MQINAMQSYVTFKGMEEAEDKRRMRYARLGWAGSGGMHEADVGGWDGTGVGYLVLDSVGLVMWSASLERFTTTRLERHTAT